MLKKKSPYSTGACSVEIERERVGAGAAGISRVDGAIRRRTSRDFV